MDLRTALADWVNRQIGKGREFEFRTNQDFANAYGISEPTVRRLRQGKKIDQDTLQRLADATGVSLVDFLKLIDAHGTEEELRGWLLTHILRDLNELPEEDQETVWDLVQSLRSKRAKQQRSKGGSTSG